MYKVERYAVSGYRIDSSSESRESVLDTLRSVWLCTNTAFVYKDTKLVLALVPCGHKYKMATFEDAGLRVKRIKEHGELYQVGNKWCFATDEGRIITDLHSCIRDLLDEVIA